MKLLKKIVSWLKKRSRNQKLVLVAIVIIGVLYIRKSSSSDEAPAYKLGVVERGSITEMVSETGEIVSSNKTEVENSITGIVKEMYVENGQQVTRGQNLYYVTSTATAQERAQAYSAYLAAKNTLDTTNRATLTYESDMWQAHETFESDSLDTELSVDDPIFIQTERDWQAAEKKYLDQKNVVAQAQAAVSNAWLNYQAAIDGYVKATADGKVANLSVAEGLSVDVLETALIIVNQADTWVTVAVNENDIVSVSPEQKAEVLIDALGESVSATVMRVDEFGTVSSDIVIYYVYLTLDETLSNLKPGMTAQVDIVTENREDILVIPNSAIKPYQGEKAVQVMDAHGNVIYQPVAVGIVGDVNTEVISGLDNEQEIVISSTADEENKSGGMFMMKK